MLTREPGGSSIGAELRGMLLDPAFSEEIDATTQLLLFAADRRVHLRKVKQALAEGKIVLCDRYIYSTMAYQLAGGSTREKIMAADDLATEGFRPQIAFWMRLEPEAAMARIATDTTRMEPDRFDGMLEFQHLLHASYLDQLGRCPELTEIDASPPIDDVAAEMYRQITAQIKAT
jgi:dTMP kinase